MIRKMVMDFVQDMKQLHRDLPGVWVVFALAVAASIGVQVQVVHTSDSQNIRLRAHLATASQTEPAAVSSEDVCAPSAVPGVTVVVALWHSSVELSIPSSNVTELVRATRSNMNTVLEHVAG